MLPYKFEAGTPRHRRRDRAGRGARLPRRDRASTRSPRTSATCWRYGTQVLEAIAGVRLIGTARDKAQHPVVRHGRRAPARHRHDPRPRRRRDPHRPPLRAAGHGALRRAGDRARLARDLQHARGDRRARPRAAQGARGLRPDVRPAATSTRKSSSTTTGGRGTSTRSQTRATPPRATTRCAATA